MNTKFRDACLTKLFLIPVLLATAWGIVTTNGQFAAQEPKTYKFKYGLTGEEWLTVGRSNRAEDSDWNPSFTYIKTSYRPVVVKHGKVWEITFRSILPEPDMP
jgi:hypothetical protein